jgi:hypothetical protein
MPLSRPRDHAAVAATGTLHIVMTCIAVAVGLVVVAAAVGVIAFAPAFAALTRLRRESRR